MGFETNRPAELPPSTEHQLTSVQHESNLTQPGNNSIVLQSRQGSGADLATLGFGTPAIVASWRDPEAVQPAAQTELPKNPAGDTGGMRTTANHMGPATGSYAEISCGCW